MAVRRSFAPVAVSALLVGACSFPNSSPPTKNLSVKVLQSAVIRLWTEEGGEQFQQDTSAWSACVQKATTQDILNKVLQSGEVKIVTTERYEDSVSYPTLFQGTKHGFCRGLIYILEGPSSVIDSYSFLTGYSR